MRLSDPITRLKGIGEKRAALFHRLEIATVGDLLNHVPYRYDDLRYTARLGEVKPGDTVEFRCEIIKVREPFYFAKGKGYVDGKVCVQGEFSFALLGGN